MNEEALMEAYVAGDPGAFQRLFRELAPPLHSFFARTVADGSAAEDLLQTTFLKLHGARSSWRRGEPLRPWVFTIAARVRLDWLRRNSRRGTEEELDGDAVAAPEGVGDPAEALLGKQRAERIRDALDRLAEPQRVVVHLHRFQGLGFAEIGRILGITEGAAKLRAFRGYAQLRSSLSDLVAEDPS